MGQYYQPIIIFPDGSSVTFDSHQYGCGIKLMEHSWIGNEFVNAVYSKILSNPRRVAWIGDYSNDDYETCKEIMYNKLRKLKKHKRRHSLQALVE